MSTDLAQRETEQHAFIVGVGLVELPHRRFEVLAERAPRHARAEEFIAAGRSDVNHVAVDSDVNDSFNPNNSFSHREPSGLYETAQYPFAPSVNLNSLRNDVKWIVTASDARA